MADDASKISRRSATLGCRNHRILSPLIQEDSHVTNPIFLAQLLDTNKSARQKKIRCVGTLRLVGRAVTHSRNCVVNGVANHRNVP